MVGTGLWIVTRLPRGSSGVNPVPPSLKLTRRRFDGAGVRLWSWNVKPAHEAAGAHSASASLSVALRGAIQSCPASR